MVRRRDLAMDPRLPTVLCVFVVAPCTAGGMDRCAYRGRAAWSELRCVVVRRVHASHSAVHRGRAGLRLVSAVAMHDGRRDAKRIAPQHSAASRSAHGRPHSLPVQRFPIRRALPIAVGRTDASPPSLCRPVCLAAPAQAHLHIRRAGVLCVPAACVHAPEPADVRVGGERGDRSHHQAWRSDARALPAEHPAVRARCHARRFVRNKCPVCHVHAPLSFPPRPHARVLGTQCVGAVRSRRPRAASTPAPDPGFHVAWLGRRYGDGCFAERAALDVLCVGPLLGPRVRCAAVAKAVVYSPGRVRDTVRHGLVRRRMART